MRSARGQGTIEYIAVVLLVALVFTGTATAATGAAPDIAAAVPREIIRALCIVRGGDCYRDRAPCDVASKGKSTSAAATVVATLAHDKRITVTLRSDGTYAVTSDSATKAGIEQGAGGHITASAGHKTVGIGAEVTAGLIGAWGGGRTWIVRTRDAAEQLARAIDDGARLPPADEIGHDGSIEAALHAQAGEGTIASVGAGATLAAGWQTEPATGKRTIFFAPTLSADAGIAGAGSEAGASLSGWVGARYALTVDRSGRWLDLGVTRTGAFSARADLPADLAAVAAALDVPTARGRSWVIDSHLDLTDRRNLAVAREFVDRAEDPLHPGRVPEALGHLVDRMEADAVVDARTYATDSATWGVDGGIAAALKFAAKYERTKETARLIAARTRGPGGHWVDRNDCTKEAGKA